MRAHLAFALGLTLAAGAATAAEEGFGPSMEKAELDHHRGGTETVLEISGSVLQNNETTQSGTNNGSITVGTNAAKVNGTIHGATVTGNQGLTAVMQNTGDLVNMNNATSVNVFLQ